VRQPSLTLPLPTTPRAPSAALLGVLWAALGLGAALGVRVALGGHDLSGPVATTALPAHHHFAPDAALTRINAAGQTVQLGRTGEDDEPVVHRAAVKVGDDYLALSDDFDGGDFIELAVTPDGRRWLAVEAFDTEAMGDLQLLASDDGGRTFVHRGTVPWPTYQASAGGLRYDGSVVEIDLTLDDEAQLADEYWSWSDRLRARFDHEWAPTLTPGHYRLRSSNGGRSFGPLRKL
jgi:hypothetical protein